MLSEILERIVARLSPHREANRVILLDHRGRQRRGGRERRREHEAELKALGVEHLYLFGSIGRGDAGADSDVDLLETLEI